MVGWHAGRIGSRVADTSRRASTVTSRLGDSLFYLLSTVCIVVEFCCRVRGRCWWSFSQQLDRQLPECRCGHTDCSRGIQLDSRVHKLASSAASESDDACGTFLGSRFSGPAWTWCLVGLIDNRRYFNVDRFRNVLCRFFHQRISYFWKK